MLNAANCCTATLTMTVPDPELPIASATALIVSALPASSCYGRVFMTSVSSSRGLSSEALLKNAGSLKITSSWLCSSYIDMSYGLSKYSCKISSSPSKLLKLHLNMTDSYV